MTPDWLLDIVAALMLAVAAVSAARLAAARPWQRGSLVIDTDIAHLLMAIAMAGMLAPSLSTLPAAAWEVIFGLLTAWFAVRVVIDAQANGVRALAGGHCAPHLVHSAAMLYMFLALTTSSMSGGMSGMSGMSGASGPMMTLKHPTLAFLFALVLVGYTVWDLDQLSGRRYHLGTARLALAGAAAGPVPPAIPAQSAAAGARPGLPASAGPRPAATAGQAVLAPNGSGDATRAASAFLLSPAVTVGCRITMGVAMAFMLIIAI
jgi:hypothetical protein